MHLYLQTIRLIRFTVLNTKQSKKPPSWIEMQGKPWGELSLLLTSWLLLRARDIVTDHAILSSALSSTIALDQWACVNSAGYFFHCFAVACVLFKLHINCCWCITVHEEACRSEEDSYLTHKCWPAQTSARREHPDVKCLKLTLLKWIAAPKSFFNMQFISQAVLTRLDMNF